MSRGHAGPHAAVYEEIEAGPDSTELVPINRIRSRPDAPHYTQGDIECVDAIRAARGREGFVHYCLGQVQKYIWRAGHKGDSLADLKKARDYLDWAIESSEQDAQG